MRCVFCRAYRSKPGHRLLSAGCTLLSTVRAQSALRAGAVAHGHYYSTRRARVCQGVFTNFSQKNGGEGGGFCPPLPSLSFLPRGRGPSQTPPSLATDSSISPGPPSPWLPALFTSAASQPPRHPWVPLTPAELAMPGASPPQGTCLAGSVSAARVQPRGCKGRSPLHKKTMILPLPAGKSALRARAGGWGQESKLKAGYPKINGAEKKAQGGGWDGNRGQGSRETGGREQPPKKTATTNQKTKKKGYQYA